MKITENFTYIGTSQNFERDSYATLAEMKAVVDKRMPDIFTATCKETGKLYIYNKNNEVDETLGKWRELSVETGEIISDSQTGLDTTWSSSKITDYISENTASQQSIADESTAREEADTTLQQSITDLEASVDEKIGSIDISAALQNVKQYDFVVDSNETLLEWANCTDGSMKSVLVKSGEYTLDGKEINLANAGTKFVFAEDGNKINVTNYLRGIGATEDYGAVIVGLNVEVYYTGTDNLYVFYRGMICYNCTGTGTGNGKGTSSGFYYCTCSNCTGTGNGKLGGYGYSYGFHNCTCSNCTGNGTYSGFYDCTCSSCTGTGTGTDTGSGYGFRNCTCSSCTGTGTGNENGSGYGFYDCTCSSCTGTGTGNENGSGYGFYDCTCSSCTGTGNGKGTSSGFYYCTCSNCTGTGNGKKGGYGFYGCSYCSSCRAGKTASTTATWGGTNTYIDSDSCDYVAS